MPNEFVMSSDVLTVLAAFAVVPANEEAVAPDDENPDAEAVAVPIVSYVALDKYWHDALASRVSAVTVTDAPVVAAPPALRDSLTYVRPENVELAVLECSEAAASVL